MLRRQRCGNHKRYLKRACHVWCASCAYSNSVWWFLCMLTRDTCSDSTPAMRGMCGMRAACATEHIYILQLRIIRAPRSGVLMVINAGSRSSIRHWERQARTPSKVHEFGSGQSSVRDCNSNKVRNRSALKHVSTKTPCGCVRQAGIVLGVGRTLRSDRPAPLQRLCRRRGTSRCRMLSR